MEKTSFKIEIYRFLAYCSKLRLSGFRIAEQTSGPSESECRNRTEGCSTIVSLLKTKVFGCAIVELIKPVHVSLEKKSELMEFWQSRTVTFLK